MSNIPIEGRVSAQDIVMILNHFENQGVVIETKSQLLRYAVTALASILLDNNAVTPVTEEDAMRILRTRFTLSDRGKRGVQRALQGIHIREDDLDHLNLPDLRSTKGLMEDAMDAMKRFEEEQKD